MSMLGASFTVWTLIYFPFWKYQDNFHWTEADHGTFNSVIKLTPDTAPCDLAVICRKPCIEAGPLSLSF